MSLAAHTKKLQPSDTAYPRFKSRPSETELERFYTPTENERTFCDAYTRSATRLGFVLLLKAYQRLGYFVTSDQIPGAIIDHIAAAIGERGEEDIPPGSCCSNRKPFPALLLSALAS